MISDIWHVWTRANDPGPSMAVLQSDEMADGHAETRLIPMIKACSSTALLLPADARKLRMNEIIFSDDLPLYINGPGINKLQTKGIRYMSLDEHFLYKSGTIGEAEGRLGDYLKMQLSKLLLISQAGQEEDESDFKHKEGDCSTWNIFCAGCGKPFPMQFTGYREDGSMWGMRWDAHKDSREHWNVSKCLDSIRYECQHCGHPHIDGAKTKLEWNRLGKYVPTNLNHSRTKRSFHWTGIIDYPWVELVEKYLNAVNAWKGGLRDGLIQFFQKYMAEPASENSVLQQGVIFKRQSYDLVNGAPDEYVRILTFDRQEEDVFWVMIRGWTKNGISRKIWYGKLFSFTDIKAKQDEFKVPNVFGDSGYKPKGDNGVYAACIRYGWIALKGDKQDIYWHTHKRTHKRVQHSYSELTYGDPESGTTNEGKGQCPLIRFGSTTYFDRVQSMIARGTWIEPVEDESDPMVQEYKRQMTAEFKKVKEDKFTHKRELVLVCPSHNNHAHDCAKMQALGATMAVLIPDGVEDALDGNAEIERQNP